jgi:hypothetical protein
MCGGEVRSERKSENNHNQNASLPPTALSSFIETTSHYNIRFK